MQRPIGKSDPGIFSTVKENRYFDRKSARKDTKGISRHVCAFANASGGKLVIDIEDGGEITGFKRNGAHDIEAFKQAPLVCREPAPVVRLAEIPAVNSRGETTSFSSSTSAHRPTTSSQDAAKGLRSFVRETEVSSWITTRSPRSNTTRTSGASRMKWRTAPR